MKVYDCFTFFNELDLLEIRLNELDDVVDYFVLVESKRSFQNKPKECHYLNNKDRFEKFNHKIIRLEVTENLFNENTRQNEINCWNYIITGLIAAKNNDIIMIGALDEIPKSEIINNIKIDHKFPICVTMNLYYYYMNTCFLHDFNKTEWHGTYITTFESLGKNNIYYSCIGDGLCSRIYCQNHIYGGWHYSSLGDEKNQKLKTINFGHDTCNHLTEEFFKERIEKLEDPFGRTNEQKLHSIETLDHLPIYVQENIEKFKKLIYTL